jgi:poly(A) polymerase
MPPLPAQQRQFAVEVVAELRAHGFAAYWAGGCVRDQLLHRTPWDYDVATDAKPEDVRRVFGRRRTLAIGAAFGVIAVVGPKEAGQVEVTTFRRDAGYSDGRHPDAVTFSSPEEDARRRDFTINGMFYDPIADQIIDYVGGAEDLRAGIVRAIGAPSERFKEDKLRMLRAVRFAAIFNFQLDPATQAAIREMAAEITIVSAERIAAEIEIMLVHPNRSRAVRLLDETGLLAAVLPEVEVQRSAVSGQWMDVGDQSSEVGGQRAGSVSARISEVGGQRSEVGNQSTASLAPSLATGWIALLDRLNEPTFALALAVLLHGATEPDLARKIGARWKLAKRDSERAAWLLEHWGGLGDARRMPWSRLQPLLIGEGIAELLALHDALSAIGAVDPAEIAHCRERLALPPAELNPPPLVTGSDLIALGIPRGKIYARILRELRAAQLDAQVHTKDEALRSAETMWREEGG